MKQITLIISEINRLNSIQASLSKGKPLKPDERIYLSKFLSQLPTTQSLTLEKTPSDEELTVNGWDMALLQNSLSYWERLFNNLPGWDYAPTCIFFTADAIEELRKNIIMAVVFAPSMAYNTAAAKKGYEIQFKDDGTAKFWLPTLEDAEKYPELYSFKGSWKEAYLLLIATLQKGWPMEEFPEELQKFLPKQ